MDEGEKANAFRKKEMEQKQTPEVESSNFFCSQTHKFLQLFNHPEPSCFPFSANLGTFRRNNCRMDTALGHTGLGDRSPAQTDR